MEPSTKTPNSKTPVRLLQARCCDNHRYGTTELPPGYQAASPMTVPYCVVQVILRRTYTCEAQMVPCFCGR